MIDGSAWAGLRRKPLGVLGAVLLVGMIGLAFLAEGVAPYGYDEADIFTRLKPSSQAHWLGTDNLGRDLLSRVIHGARVSMAVGFGGVALGLLGAASVGLVSGYFGGRLDMVVQRVVDAFMCFPLLLVALTIMALLGPGLVNVILTLGLVLAVRDSRVIRSAVLSVKENLYVEAARGLGAAHRGVILHHILPNIFAPIIILATVNLGAVILIEAALSFLGFGVPPPHPSWGGMLSGAGLVHMLRAPWLALWPGLALSLAVFGANMLGDALRDVLDPRLRGTT
ncbi:MAG: ABC transporter permease [Candidatus Rokubacteria bacterium]|nr:ABC transporter permease [Candidatus Rokubacteria bacterium]MBI2526144.1 ABC transporter permease [Candidatus Rokubacteria bacterium]